MWNNFKDEVKHKCLSLHVHTRQISYSLATCHGYTSVYCDSIAEVHLSSAEFTVQHLCR